MRYTLAALEIHPRKSPLPRQRFSFYPAAVLVILLQGCAPTPVQDPQPVPGEAPEITLNLPKDNCVCVSEDESADYTFLEKGYIALAKADYEVAVQYLQRYGRLEKSPEAEWEVAMAIAYISSLADSPFYDADEARKSWRQLNKQDWRSMQLHQQSLLMRQSLETSITLENKVAELEDSNAILRDELEKREEAIKRLRELTLGQTGVAQ
jgi:tetratricopeptide (TPR) repeat protein